MCGRGCDCVDNQLRQNAETALSEVMNKDFPTFVTKMLEVLVTPSYPDRTRHMAGTLFKRAISSLVGLSFPAVIVIRAERFSRRSSSPGG